MQDREQTGSNLRPMARGARILGNSLFVCIIVVMAMLVAFLVQSKLSGDAPAMFGHRIYVVLSGSMSPTFDAGSVAVARPTDSGELAVGDIITFRNPASPEAELVTHRIVAVSAEGGSVSFTTRGDANEADDQVPVPAENVVGRVRTSVPYAGYVANWALTGPGLLALVIVPGLLIIGFELRNLFRYASQSEKEKEVEDR